MVKETPNKKTRCGGWLPVVALTMSCRYATNGGRSFGLTSRCPISPFYFRRRNVRKVQNCSPSFLECQAILPALEIGFN